MLIIMVDEVVVELVEAEEVVAEQAELLLDVVDVAAALDVELAETAAVLVVVAEAASKAEATLLELEVVAATNEDEAEVLVVVGRDSRGRRRAARGGNRR